jgi:hypothetical protein
MNSVRDFASKINELTKNTASNILEIASLMTKAKNDLSSDDFNLMLTDTKYSKNTASVRKWLVIGKSYQRLMPIVEKLPPNWSTIYKISSLNGNDLDILEKSNVISPSMNAKDIDDVLKRTQSKRSNYKLTLCIDNLTDIDDFKEFLNEIKRHQYIQKISMNAELEELIK